MWYENVQLGTLTDYIDWEGDICSTKNQIEHNITEFYPDMFELKDILVGSYRLDYDITDDDYFDSNKDNIYLMNFCLFFILPYFPENVPHIWLKEGVEHITASIFIPEPEAIEIRYMSPKKESICKIDIVKSKNDEDYILLISGDIEGKIVSNKRPSMYFELDISKKLRRHEIEVEERRNKIRSKYTEKMKKASKEEKDKLENEIEREIMGYSKEEWVEISKKYYN